MHLDTATGQCDVTIRQWRKQSDWPAIKGTDLNTELLENKTRCLANTNLKGPGNKVNDPENKVTDPINPENHPALSPGVALQMLPFRMFPVCNRPLSCLPWWDCKDCLRRLQCQNCVLFGLENCSAIASSYFSSWLCVFCQSLPFLILEIAFQAFWVPGPKQDVFNMARCYSLWLFIHAKNRL